MQDAKKQKAVSSPTSTARQQTADMPSASNSAPAAAPRHDTQPSASASSMSMSPVATAPAAPLASPLFAPPSAPPVRAGRPLSPSKKLALPVIAMGPPPSPKDAEQAFAEEWKTKMSVVDVTHALETKVVAAPKAKLERSSTSTSSKQASATATTDDTTEGLGFDAPSGSALSSDHPVLLFPAISVNVTHGLTATDAAPVIEAATNAFLSAHPDHDFALLLLEPNSAVQQAVRRGVRDARFSLAAGPCDSYQAYLTSHLVSHPVTHAVIDCTWRLHPVAGARSSSVVDLLLQNSQSALQHLIRFGAWCVVAANSRYSQAGDACRGQGCGGGHHGQQALWTCRCPVFALLCLRPGTQREPRKVSMFVR